MQRLLVITVLVLLLGSAIAQADDVPGNVEDREAPTATAGACTPQITMERALGALQELVKERELPRVSGKTLRVAVTPCEPGRVRLEIRHGSTVLAKADRTLRTKRLAHFDLKTTKAVERRAGKRLRLNVRAVVDPARAE